MHSLIVIACVLAVAACGGKSKSERATPPSQPISNTAPAAEPAAAPAAAPAPDSPEGTLMKLSEFGSRICACADATCAQGVTDDMTKWAQQMATSDAPPMKMSDEQQKRAGEIASRMGDCMRRVMNNAPAQQPPPAQP